MASRSAWWVGIVNSLLRPVAAARFASSERSFAAADRKALRRSGFSEGRDGQFCADMRVLHEAWHTAANLSPIGRFAVQAEIVRRLETRLRMSHFLETHPQVRQLPVTRPVFITGLPRTATTLLHGLLASRTEVRAPMLWELMSPVPSYGSRREVPAARRIRAARLTVSMFQAAVPEIRAIHPMNAQEPDECVFLLPHSLVHYARTPIPGYREWFAERDARDDYLYFRQQLQALQWQRQPLRWVLKSPFHLWNLDALLGTFPDANVVWTHRDPAQALASWCSFTEAVMSLHNRRIDLEQLGEDWLRIWTEGIRRATEVRRGHPDRFIDVPYSALAADPVTTADRVTRALGLEDDGTSRQRMASYARQDRRRKPGSHRYTLERYGLSAQRVRQSFASIRYTGREIA